ncbi:adenosine monophosphate-transferase vopS domain protein, partial [Vibrio parahaemolyticus AQ3810]
RKIQKYASTKCKLSLTWR